MAHFERPPFDPETDRFLDSVQEVQVAVERSRSASHQRMMGLKLLAHGHHGEAELCLREAFRAARDERDEALPALIGLDLARIVLFRSPREALGLLKGIRETRTQQINRVCLYNLLGTAFMELCLFDQAERNLARAVESAKPGDDIFVAYAQANRARNVFEMGDPRAANGLNRRAIERLEGLGDRVGIGLVLCNMAVHYMLQAAYDESSQFIERCRAIQNTVSNLRLSAMVDLCSAELELVTGDQGRAVDLLAASERSASLAGLPAIQARAMIWKAILDQGAGGDTLQQDLEAAARDLHARDLRYDSAMVYLIAASSAEQEGRSDTRARATARAILDSDETARCLEAHYSRILSLLADRGRNKPAAQPFPDFLTQAPAVLAMKRRIHRLVDTEVRLLLEGESGTGKSYLARQIHEAGRRRSAPFVVVDCTNLEENLFESKLFGHLRGSFTGAVADSVGLVEQAHTGTLFLDEIGELPLGIQAKLLYTIEENRYRPVGARSEKRSEFRIIAATNRDIDGMLADGTLRQDLFFRLAGYRVHLEPLRERREDIVPLVDHRLVALNTRYGRRKSLRVETWEAVARYDWPGNVRELNTSLERGFHLAAGRYIGLEDLGLGISPASLDADDLSWYSVRRIHLLRVLRLCRGNVTRAARLLGLNRTTLIYKLKLLDIERSDFVPAFEVAESLEGPLRLVADREEALKGPVA